jgi:hypothetical protein
VRSVVVAVAAQPFVDPGIDRHAAAVGAVIDPAFLTEAGWDPARRVLVLHPEHPLLGRPVCRAVDCSTTAPAGSRICGSCRRRLAEHGLGEHEIASLAPRGAPSSDLKNSQIGVTRTLAPRSRRRSVSSHSSQTTSDSRVPVVADVVGSAADGIDGGARYLWIDGSEGDAGRVLGVGVRCRRQLSPPGMGRSALSADSETCSHRSADRT